MNNIGYTLIDFIPVGRENRVSSWALEQATGLNQRQVQIGARYLRDHGYPVCATCYGDKPGYWIARDQTEWDDYIETVKLVRDDYNKKIELYSTYIIDEQIEMNPVEFKGDGINSNEPDTFLTNTIEE